MQFRKSLSHCAGAQNERGSALVEFMLSSLVWMPLLLGTGIFGVNLIRAIQVSQVARNSAHMLSQGIDFSQPQNGAILTRMAIGLNIQPTSGDGGVLLSTITLITQQDCNAANIPNCANLNQYVFTSLYPFGNPAYAQTKLGSPSASDYQNGLTLQPKDYLVSPSLVVNNCRKASGSCFPALFDPPAGQQPQPGQYAYVSEVTIDSQIFNWSSFSNTGSYARSIF